MPPQLRPRALRERAPAVAVKQVSVSLNVAAKIGRLNGETHKRLRDLPQLLELPGRCVLPRLWTCLRWLAKTITHEPPTHIRILEAQLADAVALVVMWLAVPGFRRRSADEALGVLTNGSNGTEPTDSQRVGRSVAHSGCACVAPLSKECRQSDAVAQGLIDDGAPVQRAAPGFEVFQTIREEAVPDCVSTAPLRHATEFLRRCAETRCIMHVVDLCAGELPNGFADKAMNLLAIRDSV